MLRHQLAAGGSYSAAGLIAAGPYRSIEPGQRDKRTPAA